MILIKIKIRKEKDALVLELPQELAGIPANSDAEIFPLRDGFYLLSLGALGTARQPSSQQATSSLSGQELLVLDKISRVRFEQRTPSTISKLLSPEEKKSLNSLIEKNAIYLFKKGKYSEEGVYSISDLLYPRGQKKEAQASPPRPAGQGAEKAAPSSVLGGKEYAIIEQDSQPKFQDAQTLELIKKGEILGVKGFDKRLYVATRAFYDGNLPEFTKSLSSAKSPDQLADELKTNPDACRVMLILLCENGEAIEKKKGMYQAV